MTIKGILEMELLHMNDFSFKVGNIILAIVIVLANIFIIRLIARFTLKRFKERPDEYGRRVAIMQLISYVLWAISLILALQSLGLDVTFLIASSTALLVGFGLGMQNIFKDFMSGFILLVGGSIKVDDVVEINDQVLKVKKISLRTSEVLTREDNILIIPNHKFTEENVINWTYNISPTRFSIDVGVDYESDLELVEKSLLIAVAYSADILQTEEHKPFVRFINFGASALEFQLIFWSFNLFRIEATKSSIRFEIAKIFKKNGISIPFTQIVLHQAPKAGLD